VGNLEQGGELSIYPQLELGAAGGIMMGEERLAPGVVGSRLVRLRENEIDVF
jgi:hypothetical protein